MSIHDPDRAVTRDEPAQDAIATEVFVVLVEPGSIPRTTSGKIRRGAVARRLGC